MALTLLTPRAEFLVGTTNGYGLLSVTDRGTETSVLVNTANGWGYVNIDQVVTLPYIISTLGGWATLGVEMVEDSAPLPEAIHSFLSLSSGVEGLYGSSTHFNLSTEITWTLEIRVAHLNFEWVWVPETVIADNYLVMDVNYWVPEQHFIPGMLQGSWYYINPIFLNADRILGTSGYCYGLTDMQARWSLFSKTAQLKTTDRPLLGFSFNQYVVTQKHVQLGLYSGKYFWDNAHFEFSNDTGVLHTNTLPVGQSYGMGTLTNYDKRFGIAQGMGKLSNVNYRVSMMVLAELLQPPATANFNLAFTGKEFVEIQFGLGYDFEALGSRLDFNMGYSQTYYAQTYFQPYYERNFFVSFGMVSFAWVKERTVRSGFSLGIPPSVSRGFSASCVLNNKINKGVVLDLMYSSRVLAGLAADLNLSHVMAGCSLGAPINPGVRSSITVPLETTTDARGHLSAGVPMRPIVSAGIAADMGMLTFTPVSRKWVGAAPLVDNSPITQTSSFTITDPNTGEIIPLLSGSIVADEGSYGWVGTFEVEHIADLRRFAASSMFNLTIGTDTYVLMVDAKTTSRTDFIVTTATLKAISPSVTLAAPRAALLTKTWGVPMMSHDLITELCGGYPVQIQILNWSIPAYRFGVSRTSPMDAIKQIASAVGGLVDTLPDGTLRIRPAFPVPTNQWSYGTSDLSLSEEDDIFSMTEEDNPIRVFDKFRVLDNQAISGSDRLEYIELTATTGQVRAYPSPWSTDVVLGSSSPSVMIQNFTIETRDEEETIEIYNGEGNVRFPVLSVNSIQWLGTNLLGVVAGSDSTKVTSTHLTDKFSLLTISYKTRCLVFPVSGPVGHKAQFLLRNL